MHAKYILFDLDGTLVDNFTALHKAYVYAHEKVECEPPSYEKVKSSVGGSALVTMEQLIGPEKRDEALNYFYEHCDKHILDDARLLTGALPLIKHLSSAGYTLAVFTNKRQAHAELICKHLKITDYMHAVFGTGGHSWRKPQPEFTQNVLNSLSASAEDTLMIGDSHYDIEAAHAGGIEILVVSTGSHSLEALSQHKPSPKMAYADLPTLARHYFKISL